LKTFRQALQGSALAVTAQPWASCGMAVDEVLQQSGILIEGVDGIQINADLDCGVRAASVATAALLLKSGIDPIPQLNGRDRNRIALQSDLLGLRALGVTSMIITPDSRASEPDMPRDKPVFDVDCRELIAMAAEMDEETWEGAEHEFVIGTETEIDSSPDWNPNLLLARAGAGARFLQTGICLSSRHLRPWMDRLVKEKMTWKYSIIVSLAVLPSAGTARELAKQIPGAMIPSSLVKRLERAGDAETEGIEICVGLMREFAEIPGISGFHLVSAGHPEATVAVINQFMN